MTKKKGGGLLDSIGDLIADSLKAVSYTHLDVYKRQVGGWWLW